MEHTQQRLRIVRLKQALSQEDLADRVGTTPSNVSRWERGVTSPTPYFRRKLCDVFQLTPDDLFHDETLPSNNVFHYNETLEDAAECFGRTREKMTLLSRASKGESTSLVGPRRIGKTWLMKYLKLMASERFGSHVRVGYLDLTAPSCATLTGFTVEALKALHLPIPDRVAADGHSLIELEQGVRELQSKDLVPILCLDEFENVIKLDTYPGIVLEHLRAITQVGLGLVVSTRKPLIEMVDASLQTSPFFNVCHQVLLKPFERRDAESFAQSKSDQAGFTNQERDYLLQFARQKERDAWFPLRLQLVGLTLQEDKVLAAQEHPDFYRPHDPTYWQEFEARIDEIYKAVIS